jgi:glycosyltransferase involved in cell wall biosynthesis
VRKISVIIPAFNCATTVKESVLSILEGNKDVVAEVILVDDKSTDETLSVLRNLEKDYPIVKLICHEKNLGGAMARNTAVRNCSDGYIFCLDSDNVLVPRSLSQLVAFAEENDADVAAFRELHYFLDSQKNVTHLWRFPAGRFSFADYVAGTVVPGASGNYLFRKSVWEDVGGYRSGSGALDSWVFGLDLIANGKKMYVAPGGYYLHRYGLPSYWVRESMNQKLGLLAAQLIDKYLDQMDEDSRHRIQSSRGDWFELIDRYPLRLSGLDVGRAGVSVNKAMIRRLRHAFSRFISALVRK